MVSRWFAAGLMVVCTGVVRGGDEGSPLLLDPKTLPPATQGAPPEKGADAGAATRPAARSGKITRAEAQEAEMARLFKAGAYAQVVGFAEHVHTLSATMMRAESYLHLGDGPAAAPEFLELANRTRDKDERANLTAMSYLCTHLTSAQYVPMTTDENGNSVANWSQQRPTVTINVMDKSKRATAMKAYYNDLLVSTAGWLELAKTGKQMWKYNEVVREYKELAVVELVTTGKQEKSQELREKIIAAVNATVSEQLSAKENRVDVLREKEETGLDPSAAPAIVQHVGGEFHPFWPTKAPRSGLIERDENELYSIEMGANRVAPLMKRYAEDLGVEEKVFSQVEEQAARLGAAQGRLSKQSMDDRRLFWEERNDQR